MIYAIMITYHYEADNVIGVLSPGHIDGSSSFDCVWRNARRNEKEMIITV